jgi:hypothetical protein
MLRFATQPFTRLAVAILGNMRFLVILRFMRIAILGSTLLNLQLRAEVPIEIYKTRTCGCCGKWVEHLKANGFNPNVIEVPSTAEYRKKFAVPDKLQSCHTAVVGGYTVEGHVPAADIHKLLKNPGKLKGIAVPGMPVGSPGMEQGSRRDAYSVVGFDTAGAVSEFKTYTAQ